MPQILSGTISFSNKVQQGLFSAFYRLHVASPPPTFDVVETLLIFLTELSIPLSLRVGDGSVFPVPVFQGIRKWWLAGKNPLDMAWSVYIISSLVWVHLAYIAYLTYFYIHERATVKPPLVPATKVFSFLMHLSTGPLLLGVTSVLSKYVYASYSTLSTWALVYFIIALLAWLLFAIVFKTAVYEWSPLSQHLCAKAHARAWILLTVGRFVMGMLFTWYEETSSGQLLIFFCLVYQLSCLLVLLYELPFHNHRTNQIYMSIYAISAMSTLSLSFGLAAGLGGELVTIAMMCFGSLLMIPTVIMCFRWRIQRLVSIQIGTPTIDTNIELKIRLELCKGSHFSVSDKEKEMNIKANREKIDIWLKEQSRRRNKSFKIYCCWASYVYFFKSNRFLAIQRLKVILNHSPFILDILPTHIRIRYLGEVSEIKEQEEGLFSFNEQQKVEREAIQSTMKSILAQARFWGTLVSGEDGIGNLEKAAKEIYDLSNSARKSIQRLILLNPNNASFRRLFSHFLESVIHDETSAKAQLTKANELDMEDLDTQTMTSSSNCIFIISGEKHSFGHILEVNNKTCQSFGFTTSELIGKKINNLMARPYALNHDRRLSSYIEHKKVQDSQVNKLGLSLKGANNFVFEGDLQIGEYANFNLEPSIVFFGSLKLLEKRSFCIVQRSDLIIWDISAEFYQSFSPDLQRVAAFEFSITDVMPEFETYCQGIEESLQKNTSYTFELQSITSEYSEDYRVTVSYLPYSNSKFYHVVFEMSRKVGLAGIKKSHNNHDQNTALDSKRNPPMDGHDGTLKPKFLVEKESLIKLWGKEDELSAELHGSDFRKSTASEMRCSTESGVEIKNEDTSIAKNSNLLRIGLEKSQLWLHSSLRILMVLIVLLTLILCGFGICFQLVWSGLAIPSFDTCLFLLQYPVPTYFLSATYSSSLLTLLHHNVLYSQNRTEALMEEDRIKSELQQLQSQIEDFQNVLYSQSNYISDTVKQLLATETIGIMNYDGQMTSTNLYEALYQLSVSIATLQSLNSSQLVSDHRTINFLLENKDCNLTDAWDQIANQIAEGYHSFYNYISYIELAMTIVAVCLIAVMTQFVFFPLVWLVFKKKFKILNLLKEMESGSLRELYSHCITKVSEMREFEQSSSYEELQELVEFISTKRNSQGGHKRRRFEVSMLRLLTGRVNWPFIFLMFITFGYFVGCYLWWTYSGEGQLQGVEDRMYQLGWRSYYTRKVVQSVLNTDSLMANNVTFNVTQSKSFENQLWLVEEGILFGNDALDIHNDIRVMAGGYEMTQQNICPSMQAYYNASSTTECESILNGVMTGGYHEAILNFIALSQNIRLAYSKQVLEIQQILPKILVLKEFADSWLLPYNSIFSNWYYNSIMNLFSNITTVRLISTVFYVIIMLLGIPCLCIPIIYKLNSELNETRHLLTIIPIPILKQSKAVQDEVLKIVSQLSKNK